MVTSFCIDGGGRRRGGGGGGGGGGDRSSRLTRSPESDPNARGRVRGIALLCVQMKNPASHISAGTNCDATEPSC